MLKVLNLALLVINMFSCHAKRACPFTFLFVECSESPDPVLLLYPI